MSEQDYAKLVSKNLRRIMYEHGKTQAEVAKDLNISKATLSSWMNGTRIPRMNKVDLLCHYFNCKRADIMEDHDDAEPEQEQHYYLDDDAREMAEFMFTNPDYKVLFDASRKVKKEDIEIVRKIIEKFGGTDPDYDEPC